MQITGDDFEKFNIEGLYEAEDIIEETLEEDNFDDYELIAEEISVLNNAECEAEEEAVEELESIETVSAPAKQQVTRNIFLRVFNASPGAPLIDIILVKKNTNSRMRLTSNLAYSSVSRYKIIQSGTYTLYVYKAGFIMSPLASFTLKIDEFGFYTLNLTGFPYSLSPILNRDRSVPGMINMASIRFQNFSPDIEGMDLILNNRLIFSNINFRNVTNYRTIAPGNYKVSIRQRNNIRPIILSDKIVLSAGTCYTISALGLKDGHPRISSEIFTDGFGVLKS